MHQIPADCIASCTYTCFYDDCDIFITEEEFDSISDTNKVDGQYYVCDQHACGCCTPLHNIVKCSGCEQMLCYFCSDRVGEDYYCGTCPKSTM